MADRPHPSSIPGPYDGTTFSYIPGPTLTHEDDMFLSNDPWVGAAHQMDVTLLSPVFHEGKLF